MINAFSAIISQVFFTPLEMYRICSRDWMHPVFRVRLEYGLARLRTYMLINKSFGGHV